MELRSLVSLDHLSDSDIDFLFGRAADLKKGAAHAAKKDPGVVLTFFEPSTRTQFSFERALHRLGWRYSVFNSERSSTVKGETLEDTFENLYAFGYRLAIMRHAEPDIFHVLTSNHHCKMKWVNAGSGAREHPTQGLFDLWTLKEKVNDLAGKKLTIVGDVQHSRVARSSGNLAKRLGMKVCFCGPVHWVSPQWNTEGFETAHSLEKGLDGAAAVMSLRSQTERHADGSSGYPMEFQVNVEILRKRKLFLLAPGPVRFGEELTLDTKSYENNLILAQAENAVYMRQAVLEWCVP